MDIQTLNEGQDSRQGVGLGPAAKPTQSPTRTEELSPSDRRLILVSTLTQFLRRARHGFAVTSADLIRLTRYADPPRSRGEDREAA